MPKAVGRAESITRRSVAEERVVTATEASAAMKRAGGGVTVAVGSIANKEKGREAAVGQRKLEESLLWTLYCCCSPQQKQ